MKNEKLLMPFFTPEAKAEEEGGVRNGQKCGCANGIIITLDAK